MAGQTDRSGAEQTGPMARRPGSGRPRPAAQQPAGTAIPIEIGAAAQPASPETKTAPTVTSPAPLAPDILPRMLKTQAAYRLLITSGIPGPDAAGLIGYVVGLPRCDSRWTIAQVNRLLFLRSLYTETDWGEAERRPA
jgi:hypothetical protein